MKQGDETHFMLGIFMENLFQCVKAQGSSVLKFLVDDDLSQLSGLSNFGLFAGGWLTSGFTYNPSEPNGHSNGTVQFNNRANEFNLYQLGLFIDKFHQHPGAWSFVGGFRLENKERSNGFTSNVLDGEVDDMFPSHLTYYYPMLHHGFLPNLHYVLQHGYSDQTNPIGTQNAEWNSIVNYLTYDFAPKWSAGLRAEWFDDDNGTRYLTTPGSHYEISIGANWKP